MILIWWKVNKDYEFEVVIYDVRQGYKANRSIWYDS